MTEPRRLPSNIDAERAVLGAIIANPKALDRVGDLRPDHFLHPAYGRVFAEAQRLVAETGMADAVTLAGRLAGEETFNAATIIGDAVASVVGVTGIGPYSVEIIETWMKRQMLAIGDVMADMAMMPTPEGETARDLYARAMALLDDAIGTDTGRACMSLDQAMQAALDASGAPMMSTGFRSIDAILGGLEDATLNILAGRPGMGKTALGWQIAVNAVRSGIGVLAVSLEMSGKELGRRALAAASGVPVKAIKAGDYSNRQAEALVRAQRELSGLPMTIEDGGGLTMPQIDMRVRAAKRRHGVQLLVIDHLHIVRPEDRDERNGATWAVGKISRAAKQIAKRHDIPVLLLAQLSRAVEGRDDKRPVLPDLRQAGDIEQDADTVSFVYRPEYYLGQEPEAKEGENPEKLADRRSEWEQRKRDLAGKAELIVAKVRDGETGMVPLLFHGATTSFSEEQA